MTNNNLGNRKPIREILPLTILDEGLTKGIYEVPIPPVGLDQECLLIHAGLRESVYFGTFLLDQLIEKSSGGEGHLSVVMLYRYILDIGDSIATLFRLGSSGTSSLLLRTLFEAYVQISFLLEGKTFHLDRGICCWAGYRIKQFEAYSKYDPNTEEGIKFHKILDKDSNLRSAEFSWEDHSEKRKKIEVSLSQDIFEPIWKEYRERKKYKNKKSKGKKKKPSGLEWYSLCSSAQNLRALTQLIGLEAEYLLLYSWLSEKVHGSDVFSDVFKVGKQGVHIHQLRGPGSLLQPVLSLTANYLQGSHQLIRDVYFSDDQNINEEYKKWYFGGYREFFLWATGAYSEKTTKPADQSP